MTADNDGDVDEIDDILQEEQTYWYVCAYCDEGYYSLYEQDKSIHGLTLHPVCDRCWKEAHE